MALVKQLKYLAVTPVIALPNTHRTLLHREHWHWRYLNSLHVIAAVGR
jgi:hypothetical protein